MRGHLGRVMVEDLLHDVLRDIAVDQDRSQSVTPLMGS
jgi:hypothetical protein